MFRMVSGTLFRNDGSPYEILLMSTLKPQKQSLTYFTPCSSVLSVNLGHAFAGWVTFL